MIKEENHGFRKDSQLLYICISWDGLLSLGRKFGWIRSWMGAMDGTNIWIYLNGDFLGFR